MPPRRKLPKPVDPLKKRKPSVAADTLTRLERFLEIYQEGGTVKASARKCGIAPVLVYRAIRTNEEFAAKFKLAQDLNTDALEDHLHFVGTGLNNVSAITRTLQKRRPSEWKDSQSIDLNAKHEHLVEQERRTELIDKIMTIVTPKLLEKKNG